MKTIRNVQSPQSPCNYYRCELPTRYCRHELEQSGVRIYSAPGTKVGDYPDVFLWHRELGLERISFFDACKRGNLSRIVWELDDDFWHLEAGEAEKFEHLQPAMEHMRELCDWIIASTPALAESLGRPEKTLVCPNLIDARTVLPERPRPAGPVRILFAGSRCHEIDVKRLAAPALRTLLRRGVEVTFFGMEPADVPGARYVPWGDIGDYHARLASLAPDIMIAPLLDTPFNRVKTPVKWLEAASVGAAFVGSDLPPYSCVQSGGMLDGLLVRDDAWMTALEALVEEEEYRVAMARAGRARVLAEFCWQGPARGVWLDAFRRVAG